MTADKADADPAMRRTTGSTVLLVEGHVRGSFQGIDAG
jgi:hypothetical protein